MIRHLFILAISLTATALTVSGQINDTILFQKVDSIKHFKIVQYSGRIQDPPARYYVYFYKPDNKTIISEYSFYGKICSSVILTYKRQKLIKHCKKNGHLKEHETE